MSLLLLLMMLLLLLLLAVDAVVAEVEYLIV
jgi:hypothetical protein